MNLDNYIEEAFKARWWGEDVTSSLDKMKDQLYKNLIDQTKGFWSGSSAYGIMVDYGFLIDQKSGGMKSRKKLTKLGEMFIKQYEGK